MLTKMVLEVPIQAVSGLHKFCEENDVRIVTAEFMPDRKPPIRLSDDEKLQIAMQHGKMTAPELAAQYNVTPATIYRIWQEMA